MTRLSHLIKNYEQIEEEQKKGLLALVVFINEWGGQADFVEYQKAMSILEKFQLSGVSIEDAFELLGVKHTKCLRCGRELSKDLSQNRGMGKTCLMKAQEMNWDIDTPSKPRKML